MEQSVDYKGIRITMSAILLRAIDVIDGAEFGVEPAHLAKIIDDIRFLCDDAVAICNEGGKQ